MASAASSVSVSGATRTCRVSLFICLFLLSWLNVAVSGLDVKTSTEWNLFESFLTNFSRTYRNDLGTLQHKFSAFQQSLERHRVLNAYEMEVGGTAVYGINKFSDLTPEEFRGEHLSPIQPTSSTFLSPSGGHSIQEAPKSYDWRKKNVIGPIRDQQRCGSCWAFAVVESIASKYAIDFGGKLYQLSPQQLISCDYNPAKYLDGCKGGTIQNALETIRDQGMVVVLEDAYPFVSKNGETLSCKPNLPNVGVQVKEYKYNQTWTAAEMATELYKVGPLTTSVNAVSWQDYIGGVIQHHCTGTFIDHAIQIVGYDTTDVVPYWIIRNTWGTDWGEKGYVRIKMGDNICGLQDQVASVLSVNGVNL